MAGFFKERVDTYDCFDYFIPEKDDEEKKAGIEVVVEEDEVGEVVLQLPPTAQNIQVIDQPITTGR